MQNGLARVDEGDGESGGKDVEEKRGQ